MNLDKERTIAFLKQVLSVASIFVKFTPNQNDDAVVSVFQRLTDNADLMDLLFELLDGVFKNETDVEALAARLKSLHNKS